MNQKLVEKVKNDFYKRFGSPSLLVRAPGRINLIGEHTDYNDGFVLPTAVDQAIYFAISTTVSKSNVYSIDFDESYEFTHDCIEPLSNGSWQNYVMGAVAEMEKMGCKVPPFNMVFSGDIPRGSGMSSSAALECGTAWAINQLFELGLSKLEIAQLSQKAEHNYAGVQCGIMDQFASAMGQANQALLLDCQTLSHELKPIFLNDYELVLLNSNVTHSLADSAYNERRQQCQEGIDALTRMNGSIRSLRMATISDLESIRGDISEVVYKRCKYVIEENQRVLDFVKFLEAGQLKEAGELLNVAQMAMKNEYEITCPEIDFMAEEAIRHDGVLGARMMGGGFGGCTINIVHREIKDTLIHHLSAAYRDQFKKELTPIEVKIDDGVSVIK